jgi:hypothetical protein
MPRPLSKHARRAAVAVVLLVGLFVAYLAIVRRPPSVPIRATACMADGPTGQGWQLGVSQASIAATIAGVANKRAMPTRALAIAYAAALQESGLADLDYGDRDSVGVFQQRPSQGWGSPKEIENPVYATTRFFEALAVVPGYLKMPIYAAAQAVQRSADGQAYGEWAAAGSQMALAFSGQLPHAVWCSYSQIPRTASLVAASRALDGSFGPLRAHADGDPPPAAGRRPPGQLTIHVSGQRQGWSVAAWLVCNANSYGIRYVRYLGYQWLSYTGSGHWARQPQSGRRSSASAQPPVRAGTAAGAVVFG